MPDPRDLAARPPTRADHDALLDQLAALEEGVAVLTTRLEQVTDLFPVLRDRLDALEEAGKPRPRHDAVTDKILAFMASVPGVKLTGAVVAANIDEDNATLGSRMTNLVRKGAIRADKRDGRHTTFWYPAPDAS